MQLNLDIIKIINLASVYNQPMKLANRVQRINFVVRNKEQTFKNLEEKGHPYLRTNFQLWNWNATLSSCKMWMSVIITIWSWQKPDEETHAQTNGWMAHDPHHVVTICKEVNLNSYDNIIAKVVILNHINQITRQF